MILIRGLSGVGKSSLVKVLEENVKMFDRSLCITGKFIMTSNDRPYLGFTEALDDAFRKVKENRNVAVSKVIQAELSGEVQLLSYLIPSLRDIVEDHPENASTHRRSWISKNSRMHWNVSSMPFEFCSKFSVKNMYHSSWYWMIFNGPAFLHRRYWILSYPTLKMNTN